MLEQEHKLEDIAAVLGKGEIPETLPANEKALLEFVKTVTLHSYKVTENTIENLKGHGYSDEQIAEAVYIASLFALFNRVADAFGI